MNNRVYLVMLRSQPHAAARTWLPVGPLSFPSTSVPTMPLHYGAKETRTGTSLSQRPATLQGAHANHLHIMCTVLRTENWTVPSGHMYEIYSAAFILSVLLVLCEIHFGDLSLFFTIPYIHIYSGIESSYTV